MRSLGYLLISISLAISLVNFYWSFLRFPIYRFLGKEYFHRSGLPLMGSLFLLAALYFYSTPTVWVLAVVSALLDTGGLLWFLATIIWVAGKKDSRYDGPSDDKES